ncbi:MAG: hypothetical protein LBV22_02045 [Mycoplasmataceae bacterium]|jgi:hypothetical protein|nr:hypothetical protein [Mycoplasmataceae bacterium]
MHKYDKLIFILAISIIVSFVFVAASAILIVSLGNQITDAYVLTWNKTLYGIVCYYSYLTNTLIFVGAIIVICFRKNLKKIFELAFAVSIYSFLLTIIYWTGVWSTPVNDINEGIWYSIIGSIFLHVIQPIQFVYMFVLMCIKLKFQIPAHIWKNLYFLIYPAAYFGLIIILNFIPIPEHPNGIIIYGPPTNWNSLISGNLWNLMYIPLGVVAILFLIYAYRYVNNRWIAKKNKR